MAITLADLLGKPKSLTVELVEGESSLNITYYPNFVSEEFEGHLARLSQGGSEAAKDIADTMHSVMAGWDLADLPYSREALSRVPTEVLAKIMQAIMGDARPNQATAPN